MNKFYRKPKPETMKKNREFYAETFKKEIAYLKEKVSLMTQHKNKFMIEMYTILVSGSRKITPKMAESIKNGIKRMDANPVYNPDAMTPELKKKLDEINTKIYYVEVLAEQKNDKALGFVRKVKAYVKENCRITRKQMEALNKVHKRVSEDLFEKGEKDD
tara:strand:+ start:1298 stop:1777 length:480 start_codon:yes stop_codon:yes gene_type:complete